MFFQGKLRGKQGSKKTEFYEKVGALWAIKWLNPLINAHFFKTISCRRKMWARVGDLTQLAQKQSESFENALYNINIFINIF
jgi:hypothetical protein